MSRGPNPPRYLDADHASAAWVDLPENVARDFPALTGADLTTLGRIWAAFRHAMADAGTKSARQGEQDRAAAIECLERATMEIARAMQDLPEQVGLLGRAFALVAQAQIAAKQVDPGKVPVAVPSEADAKKQAARAVLEFAEQRGLDGRELVRAMGIHEAHSAEAWAKWIGRT